MILYYFFFLLFILGLVIGSFLNVVIYRTKTKESVIFGRSFCPSCKKSLKSFELIPLISFLWLRGKCRNCQEKISWQYFIVELTTGILFVLAGLPLLVEGGIFFVIRNLIFISFAIIIFVYDLKWQIVPDRYSIPAIFIILFLNLFLGISIWSMLFGALIAGGFFFVQYAVSRGKWIGGGDIRLGILMGVLLGFEKTFFALLLAYVVGAIISVFLLVLNKKKMKSEVAFGTFLMAGSIFALLFGDFVINWYLNLI